MHVRIAGEMLEKSLLQTCCFRASPGLLSGFSSGMGHFHPRSGLRLALLPGMRVSKTWGRQESAESTAAAKAPAVLGSAWQRTEGLGAHQAAAWKASRAGGACTGRGLYLLLVPSPREYIGNATLSSLDECFLLPQSCIGCNKLLMQGVYRAL